MRSKVTPTGNETGIVTALISNPVSQVTTTEPSVRTLKEGLKESSVSPFIPITWEPPIDTPVSENSLAIICDCELLSS